MEETITVPKKDFDRLQERARKLAQDKSYLQLVNDLMNSLSSVTGLDNVVNRIIRLILDNIGGVNVAVYYVVDSRIHYADVYGGKKALEAVDDAMVRTAFETRAFMEETKAFSETMMMTPEFTKASTWAMPLLVGERPIGALKMEGMLMAAQEVRSQLQPFFNYAALVLNNEIEDFSKLKEANDRLQRSNNELKGAQDALRVAYEELEARVVERTIDLQEANRLLTVELAERKKAEEALKTSEESIRLIIDASPVAGVVSSGTDERVLFINRKFTDLFGYTLGDMPDVEHWWPLAYPDEEYRRSIREAWKARIEKAVREKREIEPMEARVSCKDGSERYIEFGFASIGDRNIVTFTDLTERQRVEQRISLLNFAMNNVSEAAFLIDDQGRFHFVNEEACRILGYSRGELLGLGVQEVDPDFPNERWSSHWEELRRKRSLLFEGRHRTKDGRELPVEINANYFEYEGKEYNLALVHDVTERKRAERERQGHLWFLESLDRINRAIHGKSELGQMMNDAMEAVSAIFGCDRTWLYYPCDPDSPTFRVPMEVMKPEYPGHEGLNADMPMPPELARMFREALASADPRAYIFGTEKPVDNTSVERFGVKSMMLTALYPGSGKPWAFGMHQCSHPRVWTPEETRLFKEIGRRLADSLGILLTYRDLRDGLIKLTEAQRIAHIGYWDRDFVSGRISLADEACRIFGLTPQESVLNLEEWHDYWLALIHADDRQKAYQAFVDALEGVRPYSVEYRIVRPDGELRHIHSEASVTRDASGRPLRMLGMMQDISRQKQAEEELRALNEGLDQRVKQRTAELEEKNAELERMNRIFVGRELRMAELKARIRELEAVVDGKGRYSA